jgi:hypothetical protein
VLSFKNLELTPDQLGVARAAADRVFRAAELEPDQCWRHVVSMMAGGLFSRRPVAVWHDAEDRAVRAALGSWRHAPLNAMMDWTPEAPPQAPKPAQEAAQ